MKTITFDTSDSRIEADIYPGPALGGVILAHGKAFNKDTWQELADILRSQATVMAINFRGYGNSVGPGGLEENDIDAALPFFARDLIGAADYLEREVGAETLTLVGGSMGGGAAAEAAIEDPDHFARLVLLSPVPVQNPEKIHTGFLEMVVSRNEPLYNSVQSQYEKIKVEKHLTVYEGGAHAQHLFNSPHREALIELIKSHCRPM